MPTTETTAIQTATVERHGIAHVAEDARYGHPRNQFTIRFSPVIYLAGIFVGATGGALGLGLWGSITAIALGNLLGAIGTGMCAVMGPKLGMPQLPMGRAPFGYRGNVLPAALSVVVYIGYYTVGTVLGGKSLADLFNTPEQPMVVLVALLSIVIGIYGYQMLHVFGQWITYISIVMLAVVTVFLIAHGGGPGTSTSLSGTEYWSVWALQFTVVFGYTVSWSPYASDYSRYLPRSTRSGSIFGYATSGLFAATTWMMVLGAALIALNPNGDVLDAFDIALPDSLRYLVLLVLGLSAIPHNSVNLYSGAMATLTCDLRIKQAVIVTVGGVLGGVLALAIGGSSFEEHFSLFLHVISYYIMPWLAVLAVAYFKVYRNGNAFPASQEFYEPAGLFRGVAWPGMGAFLAGIVVSIPFMANEWYTGPIASQWGDVDFSYFVSGAVAAVVYAVLAKPVGAPAQGERTN